MAVGKQAIQQEKWEDAQKFFDGYLRDNPDNAEAQFYLGFAFFGEKQYANAEQVYLKMIAANPKLWAAHISLAEVYAAEERWADFDRERSLLRQARDRGEPGTSKDASDVIDVLYVGSERYIVREFHQLDGRVHTRYRFMHFDSQGKMDSWFACESDDIDQLSFAKQHPDLAAQGKRSFSLDSYAAPVTLPDGRQTRSEGLIKFYWDGEPPYETVRADVLGALQHKTAPAATMNMNGAAPATQPAPTPQKKDKQ
jgi:tetratricopeptide (TPR) repeat protein